MKEKQMQLCLLSGVALAALLVAVSVFSPLYKEEPSVIYQIEESGSSSLIGYSIGWLVLALTIVLSISIVPAVLIKKEKSYRLIGYLSIFSGVLLAIVSILSIKIVDRIRLSRLITALPTGEVSMASGIYLLVGGTLLLCIFGITLVWSNRKNSLGFRSIY
ncbi:hypothetical protein [Enterococcus larvae]|uniref:hypothetical protein n=1 Tax=Enterococcus larvae TaxID=2794352 RepID=UPI003F32F649